MASIYRYLHQRYLRHRLERSQNVQANIEEPEKEVLNFVVPQEECERFAILEFDSDELSVQQYMFLFRYSKSTEQNNAPGSDYTRASYIFGDGDVQLLLKGWVPTKPSNTFSRSQDAKRSTYYASFPRGRSAYNIGMIRTWSRHCADTSGDDTPMQLIKPTVFKPDFTGFEVSYNDIQRDQPCGYSQSFDMLTKVRVGNTPSHRVGSCEVMTSTFNPRDRRLRPMAAKGRRSHNVGYKTSSC